MANRRHNNGNAIPLRSRSPSGRRTGKEFENALPGSSNGGPLIETPSV